ncbi:uncharacterized protein EDB93DRAFT_1180146 [Suillus bovinus]|uniref:uncharacterized protein n=1 Tax=Suillus bovinus TaxID=48563 RepID=UPI001B87994D|nr:uncharacterized protein EDB93DRAFT_1180146 [Suillus bovinus]KAG2130407.1 hypothetical protein EDB93DRAFT_1180146 [Suillus bovinus]
MKFTSLTTIIISAAAMAGIAIASQEDNNTPMGSECPNSDTRDAQHCGPLNGFNKGKDIIYYCGYDGIIETYIPCTCENCCRFTGGRNIQCPT